MSAPLDSATTGGLANSRITDERHTFTAQQTTKIAVLKKGCGYWIDIRVVDAVTGIELVKDTEYKPLDLCAIPTKITGKDIYSTIVVTKAGVNSVDVSYSYPDDFQSSLYAILALENILNILTDPNRPVYWNSITDRPVGFNPTEHRHNLSQSTGYEYLINTLDQLIKIMILGDGVSHDQLRQYFDQQLATHFSDILNDFNATNDSTLELLRTLLTKISDNINKEQTLSDKLDTLIVKHNTYQSSANVLNSSVTSSTASATAWLSAISY